jgi:peptidoglycan/xylan/chitin deacetylase (PgdA/CDA1 family)
VALTFDDDLASHRAVAMPILQELGIPATFFLCRATLDRPYAYWWERLERAAELGLALRTVLPGAIAPELEALAAHDEVTIHQIGRTVAYLSPQARRACSEHLACLVGPDPNEAGMRAADVHALVAAGFDVGFHTRDHDLLPTLDEDALARAMDTGRGDLEAIVGFRLDMIAYPHGKSAGRVASAAVRPVLPPVSSRLTA